MEILGLMRIRPTVLICVVFALVAAESMAATGMNITNTSGEVFENVTIKEVRPDGLKILHSKGVAVVPFRELSPELQTEHNYNPEIEAAYKRDTASAHARAKQRRALTAKVDSVRESGLDAHLKVLQVTDEGILATGYYTVEEEYEYREYLTVTKQAGLARADYTPTRSTQVPVKRETRTRTARYELPDRIFLISSFSNLVDDDWFTQTIYPCGRHKYTNVMGGAVTVERYATTPEKALALLTSVE